MVQRYTINPGLIIKGSTINFLPDENGLLMFADEAGKGVADLEARNRELEEQLAQARAEIEKVRAEREVIIDAGTEESNLVVHLQGQFAAKTAECERMKVAIKKIIQNHIDLPLSGRQHCLEIAKAALAEGEGK